ncbi:MAG TPA: transcriptional repressor LexA [Gemmatimonadaceae bacterium]|nr:transcriptional repressor LexA [Gemmatimonadaceae bacterium]
MTDTLTPLERRVYHYLIDFLAENTYQPSIREIAKKFRIKSTKTVSDLLGALSQKGFIERDQSRSRGVRIVGYAGQASTQPVPYYGRVHAGEPALLPDHRKGYLTMDRRFLPTDDVFFLRIKGDSMIGRGIFESDYVLVSPSTRAKDGDIVAARLGDEATIKTLTHKGGTIVLEPANESERAIEVGPKDDFAVLGVVCGVFRPFMESIVQPTLPTTADAELVC